MSTTFIDTNGEMSFEDNERLKFIIHYLKKGASNELIKTDKNGRFINEDSELAFTDIWLASAQHQQSKVEELQKREDASNKVLESMRKEIEHGHLSEDESQTLSSYANDLERALKGGES